MALVTNPILPGFHPDPSIVRMGDFYYLATSTFEWWPGVQINRSRDLANWELCGYALTRTSQLDMLGNPDSGGVWAPALSYADGKFWLIYSDVKNLDGPFKDVRNYLVTAERAEGPWSDPVFLNSSGFDPSLFHDADGRKWFLNQLWDPRPSRNQFAGIVLQEYSAIAEKLIGTPLNIFSGSSLGVTEGPHLYRKDGYYYLMTAEGGTGWAHAVTVARSRSIAGPYEISPHHPLLTAHGRPQVKLQKAGHGSLVQTKEGRWYLAHLCSRPVGTRRRCILGRETALQRIDWPDGDWPQLADGGNSPLEKIEVPEAREATPYQASFVDDFSSSELSPHWNTLRVPAHSSWLDLSSRPGHLRLIGRYSLNSRHDQSLVGTRALHHRFNVSTRLSFNPTNAQQRAGLVLYYNTANFHYLYVGGDGQNGRELQILTSNNRQFSEALATPHKLPATGAIELHAKLDGCALQFLISIDAGELVPIGPTLDATILSDDYHITGGAGWAFTGLFVALCAQDNSAEKAPADFDWFRYQAVESEISSPERQAQPQASSL